MNNTPVKKIVSDSSRSGIALVIVLGLLAVLIIFSVSFTITSRTERMATRSYGDVVKARQLAQTAFNRVLSEYINKEMNGLAYPPWDAFGPPSDTSTNGLKLLGAQTMDSAAVFVPMSLRAAAFAADSVSWQEMYRRGQPQNAENFLGEFGFLVVNCSGLLDANTIGAFEDQANPRGNGADPGEIRFSDAVLPEAVTNGARALRRNRDLFKRYESIPELYYLASSSDFGAEKMALNQKSGTSATVGSMANSLHVFSREPFGFANNADLSEIRDGMAMIGGALSNASVPEISSALNEISGRPIPDTEAFARVIVDYATDTVELAGSNEQEKFARISSKPVPMINEIIISNSFKLVQLATNQILEHRIYLTIETWNPFTRDPDDPSFRLDLSGPPLIPQVAPPTFSDLRNPPTLEVSATPPTFRVSDSGYNLTTFVFVQRQPLNPPAYVPGLPFSAFVTPPVKITVLQSNTPVDMVIGPWPDGKRMRLAGRLPALTSGGDAVFFSSDTTSTIDPRINWRPDDWARATPETPGSYNRTRIETASDVNRDEVDFMYARRGPIQSVTELSYLLYDASKPWSTIRLGAYPPGYPASMSEVFSRLHARPADAYPRRGVVNPNTRQTNALAAALWTLPINKYPGQNPETRLSIEQTRDLVSHLREQIQTKGPLVNTADIFEIIDGTKLDRILDISEDKFTRESVMRYTYDLLSTRHHLFTIFVAARTFADAYDPASMSLVKDSYVTSEQRAVAVIWRDPFSSRITYPDGSISPRTHQSWIQYFHWFSGAFGD